MKTIVAGSRTIFEYHLVEKAIEDSRFTITEVVSGTAKGVDKLGEQWAKKNGIPIKRFWPDYTSLGKRGALIRNQKMAEYVGSEGALVAVWDGKSTGTLHMVSMARLYGLKTYVVKVEGLEITGDISGRI